MKRILSLLLCLLFLAGLSGCGEPSVTAEGTCGKYARWTLDSTGLLTISGRGAVDDFAHEAAPWYDRRSSVRAVTVGEDITRLGSNSFQNCDRLETVSLPEGLGTLGDSVFAQCDDLTAVSGSEHLTVIGDNAFDGCKKLPALELGEGLTSIGRCAFYGCVGLKELHIPASVTDVGSFVFSGWTAEQTVSMAHTQANRAWSETWDEDTEAVILWNS